MYSNILVPIDGSATSQRGLDEALALARAFGSTLHVLRVADTSLLIARTSLHAAPDLVLDDLRAADERLVFDAAKRARDQGIAATPRVRHDLGLRVAEAILLTAEECHADLIVMGTHGRRGLQRTVLGSDAEDVLRKSRIPVLLVRGPKPA